MPPKSKKAAAAKSASFKPARRYLSPAEQAAAKEAAHEAKKHAFLERCAELDREGDALQHERDELHAELERLAGAYDNSGSAAAAAAGAHIGGGLVERGEKGLEDRITASKAQCKELQAQVETVKQKLVDMEKRDQEAAAQHTARVNMLVGQRKAMAEDIAQIRTRAAHFEERASRLQERVDAAQETLRRGDDEKDQLQEELWERQGERAVLSADQASAARLGAEQRAQASSLESHVSQLASVLSSEDHKLRRDQFRFRTVEKQLGAHTEDQRREHERAAFTLPQRIEQERLEAVHSRKVYEHSQRELLMSKDAVHQLQEKHQKLMEQVQLRVDSLWRAEGMCEAARAAYLTVEADVSRVNDEVQQLQSWLERVGKQNRRMLLSQLPLRNTCSALEQENLQAEVLEYLEKIPVPREGSPTQKRGQPSRQEVGARAARLGLAGLAAR